MHVRYWSFGQKVWRVFVILNSVPAYIFRAFQFRHKKRVRSQGGVTSNCTLTINSRRAFPGQHTASPPDVELFLPDRIKILSASISWPLLVPRVA